MTDDVVARTPPGRLRGARDGQALRFLGIPYAESPVTAGRFVTDGDPGWESFGDGRSPVMIFDEPSEVRENPLELERAAWEAAR
jgi:carboxylesterase type B